jgi:hypothetical protein
MTTKVHSNLDDLSAFDFPVKLVAVASHKNDTIVGWDTLSNWKAVKRMDTGETLAIHSSQYHLTPHVDIFKGTIQAIRDAFGVENRHDDQFKIKDFVINGGRQVCREIIVKTEQVYGPDGHPIQFRLRQINSYDGSSKYYSLAGTYREWCSNGAASLLGTISSTSQKHTSRIDLSAEVGKLRKAIEFFRREPELYKAWAKTEVTTEQVKYLFEATLCRERGSMNDPQNPGTPLIVPRYNVKQWNILMDAWERNSMQLGRNKWAIYQAATWWASHGEGKTRTVEEISLEREPKVLAMVQSEEWDVL